MIGMIETCFEFAKDKAKNVERSIHSKKAKRKVRVQLLNEPPPRSR